MRPAVPSVLGGVPLRSVRQHVHDLFAVWRDTRLIVLVAQTAAVYAAVLIPFKVGIPLIPGFAELRPANALPVAASLLFGPAAAWGAGLGNLIGDCFGTLGPASLFGFVGNFWYGYVPYLLWGRLGPLSSGREPEPRSWRQVVEFALVCAAASAACALTIGWGVDLLGLVPFKVLTTAIFFNNLLMSLLLAPALLFFLHPRVKRWGLRYEDLGARAPDEEDKAQPEEAAPAEGAPLLAVERLRFTYAGAARPALRDLSFTLERGESLAVMGRSGAGKSTLCYALNGLIPHLIPGERAGLVRVEGREAGAQPVWRQAGAVGLVFQDFEAQLVSTNIEMELAFPLALAGRRGPPLSRAEMAERIARTLALTGLAGLERRNPLTLSGGQRQRLVIGSVLVPEPALLVLDEPFTDLDPAGRQALSTLLRRLKVEGTSLLLVDHDPEEAVAADRVLVLDGGGPAWEGRPRDLFGCAERPDLPATLGLRPLPLAQCFAGLGLPALPLTVEEAWRLADEHRLTLAGAAEPRPSSEPEAKPLIECRGVSYGYERGTPVLAGLDLTIREGEFLAILGENGSGKSTLAKLFNGLHLPDCGTVLVEGGTRAAWAPAGSPRASAMSSRTRTTRSSPRRWSWRSRSASATWGCRRRTARPASPRRSRPSGSTGRRCAAGTPSP